MAAQANFIPSCSTELYRKDTLQVQFLESTPFSTPTVTFFTQSFNPYGAHNSSNRNTTLQRCACPNARARIYITLYGKGALRI